MSAYVLSNLSNESGKRNKSEACRAFYRVFFCYEFYKFNNTGARMLSYDPKTTFKSRFVEYAKILPSLRDVITDVII